MHHIECNGLKLKFDLNREEAIRRAQSIGLARCATVHVYDAITGECIYTF